MNITQRIPNPIAPLTTEGLVKLLSAPQKAAELWQVYTQHREAYEAQRASIAAEQASLDKRAAEQLASDTELNAAWDSFEIADKALLTEKTKWEVKRYAVEEGLAKREAELASRDTFFQNKERELNKDRSEFNEWQKSRQALATKYDSEYLEREALLIDREAAVAAREKKAEELAKLLKGI